MARSDLTFLYRCYDAAGTLLYVGVALDLEQRMREHRMATTWYRDEVTRIELGRYPDRASALEAERQAIQAEAPKHNRQGQPAREHKSNGGPGQAGIEFRQLQAAAGLSVRQAATYLGVNPATIQRWRNATTDRSPIPAWAVTRLQHRAAENGNPEGTTP
jgi:predicted GIY-YIG superfamily endonuclease